MVVILLLTALVASPAEAQILIEGGLGKRGAREAVLTLDAATVGTVVAPTR